MTHFNSFIFKVKQIIAIAFFLIFTFWASNGMGNSKIPLEDMRIISTYFKDIQNDNYINFLTKTAFKAFSNKQYAKAAQYFASIFPLVKSAPIDKLVAGYLNASFYGSRNYKKALRFICDFIQNNPERHVFDKYDVHAHVRAIAIKKGRGEAELYLTKLRSHYENLLLSPVWAGIPLVKMEYLAKGWHVYKEEYKLFQNDRDYLEYIIKKYPNDMFLDHAFYFLHDFKQIVKNYEESPLVEFATYLYWKTIYRSDVITVDNVDNFVSNYLNKLKIESNEAQEIIRDVIYYYADELLPEKALLLYDSYSKKYNLYPRIIESLLRLGRLSEAQEIAYEQVPKLSNKLFYVKNGRSKFEWIYRQERNDIGWELLEEGEFHKARKFYERIAKYLNNNSIMPTWFRTRLDKIAQIDWLIRQGLCSSLLVEGIKSRDFLSLHIASTIFKKVLSECNENSLIMQKAHYLLGATYKRMGHYKQWKNSMEIFTQLYPDSHLADDALADVGVYYEEFEQNNLIAEKYYLKVIKVYSDGNAKDNVMYRLANILFHHGEVWRALKLYKDIIIEYPRGRIAKKARRFVNRREYLNDFKKQKDRIEGIVFDTVHLVNYHEFRVLRVIDGSYADFARVYVGDIIFKINGIQLDSIKNFVVAMKYISSKSYVEVEILRDNYHYLGKLKVGSLAHK